MNKKTQISLLFRSFVKLSNCIYIYIYIYINIQRNNKTNISKQLLV